MKCSCKRCDREAVASYFWFNDMNLRFACREHALQIQGLGDIIGYYIPFFELPVRPPAIEPEADKPRDNVASDVVTEAERQALKGG
jgi:hypothetical protein